MKVAIAGDHGGIELKNLVVEFLRQGQYEVDDQGCYTKESVDYPDYGKSVCQTVLAGSAERGILICGTGLGMSMVANRFSGIRAALGNELFSARMSREHNDANVLCMGARVIGPGLALEIVKTWLETQFAGGRHKNRIDMF